MAINSSQIDLNSDAVLFDRENVVVVGVKSSVFNVSVDVSHSETLSGDPVSGGEVVVRDQKVFDIGDDGGVGGSVELVSRVNHGCDVMINGSGNEGFCEESELVGLGIGLEDVDGKEGVFSCGAVKNEDQKSGVACSHGGLVFGFSDGSRSELECENARDVTGNGLLVVLGNVVQGGDNDAVECGKEVKNDVLVSLSAVVEDDGERNGADSLVTDGLEDLHAVHVATCQLQDGVPCMEVVDVNADESLHVKGLSGNCLELEASYELKKLAIPVDAQLDPSMMENQTMDIDISEARLFENVENESDGFNLVVDLNSYRNMREVGMYCGTASSELNFCVSDLVWGKVTGHPWWPGQIFDASSASDKAKRHHKEDCYLVAYFGDQTFAWNDVSMIKPFQMHFSQMEKQSNLEIFHHAVDCALDEVSRRVELGLSCPCIPEDEFFKLKTQVISNTGIHKQLSRRNGGDRFVNAMSFEPMNLVNYVKSLAQSPLVESDRLDFVTARSQLLAFYRSKGYSQLPEFTMLGGLFDNDMETLLMGRKEQCDYQTHVGYSQCKESNSKRRSKKHKLLSDLMCENRLCMSNGEHTSEQKAQSVSRRPGRKRKMADNTPEDYFHNSKNRRLVQLQHASTNEMRSQLCLAATDPIGESFSTDMVHFFAKFRNSISIDYSASPNLGMSSEQIHDGATGVISMTSAMEPCNDSYWTDRIIQSIPEEQSLTKYQNKRAIFLPETLTEANPLSLGTDLSFKQQDTDSNLGSESSKLVEHLDESSKEGICPTALTLKFTNLNSVPSTTDLNKIFGRFGPLIEPKTELLERTNSARVVFQKRSNAESAFSSAGKYSIFGPSLVSYRLKILPRKQQKAPGKRGRKRKETSTVDGAAI